MSQAKSAYTSGIAFLSLRVPCSRSSSTTAMSLCISHQLSRRGTIEIVPKRRRARVNNMNGVGSCAMCSDNRSAEFTLGRDSGNSGAAETGDDDTAPAEFDWASWTASGTEERIPMLPFPPEEIFLPGETKSLHLYEARFLALFEHVVLRYGKSFAHVLFAVDRAALAAYGTIVRIVTWRRLDVGVYIEVEGVARFRISQLRKPAPFWIGHCSHIEDLNIRAPDALEELRELEERFWPLFREVVSLCVRLGADPIRKKVNTALKTMGNTGKNEPVQSIANDSNGMFILSPHAKIALFEQKLKKAASRAVNYRALRFGEQDVDDETRAARVRGLSFAGWDFFPSNASERQKALEGRDTLVRMRNVIEGLGRYGRNLAAKVAVQDAFSASNDDT